MILCADDFGLSDDADQAILTLCAGGKLTSVSCMVGMERCTPSLMARVRAYETRLDIGLHLCLAKEGVLAPGGAPAMEGARGPSFKRLLCSAVSRRLDRAEIERQIRSQYNLFVTKCGRKPDYVDGHLHAHQLPGIRNALVDFILRLPSDQRPYVRNTAMSLRNLWRLRLLWIKAAVISLFGSAMRRKLHAAGIRTNEDFAGIYPFANATRYPEYLQKFAAYLSKFPDGILVVHPGEKDEWRREEYRALTDFKFAAASLNRFQGRFPDQGEAGRATSAMPLPR